MTEQGNVERVWPRRQERAAQTRDAIVRAATRLLVERGYTASTMADIALAAGVSRATVFNAVGGKAAVLRICYDIAVVGDDEPLPLPLRPEMQAMFAEPDAQRTLELYAAIIAGIGQRTSALYEVFRAAASGDVEIAAMWHDVQQERLKGARYFVAMLTSKATLRTGLTPDEAADLVWLHIDNGQYHRLVIERGWTQQRFTWWFAQSLGDSLLGQSAAGHATGHLR